MQKLGSDDAKRVLLVGLIKSVRELYETSVVDSISKICFRYQSRASETMDEGFVELQVLYQQEGTDNPNSIIGPLTERLQSAGCRTNFIREDRILTKSDMDHIERSASDTMSRYRKLARLRSVQRSHILSEHSVHDYDVVVNADLDIVQFPPLDAMMEAIDRASEATKQGVGSVVCANGHETWTVGSSLIQRRLYYDTFAAIDIDGDWYYTKYAADLWQIITFGQTRLFRNILEQHPSLWQMQTCFGGLALYDYPSWANNDCDYDQDKIALRATGDDDALAISTRQIRGVPAFEQKIEHFQDGVKAQIPWKLPSRYTINHTPNGDVCEHVVFQQCLQASARSRAEPLPHVGIQPNLLIGREAAILSKWEDKVNFCRKVLLVLLVLYIISILVNHMREFLEQKYRNYGVGAMRRRSSDGHFHKA
ncbi:expressed unknown protein [Seminavis robusta]|uniref:Uncharacterized protein n=1 Tax=Seminavis robusta TaxID=568900 RepID=A0A9N8D795_9STRA|nr:expressed unknown protein [Seminavis robusta]|eukprot:Sro26_g017650.1 n/a (423) ;mRNA; f:81273-82541